MYSDRETSTPVGIYVSRRFHQLSGEHLTFAVCLAMTYITENNSSDESFEIHTCEAERICKCSVIIW